MLGIDERMGVRDLPEEVAIDLGLDEPDDDVALREQVARALRVSADDLPDLVLRKRSLDARHGRVRHRLLLALSPEAPAELGLPHPVEARRLAGVPDVVVVGAGPAGLFAAYGLARAGIPTTVVDRGKRVQPRRHDLKALNRHGVIDGNSNYCFGEGGAGTYSDGKLYTRSHKRGNVRDVLEVLVRHGAPADVLTEARPHIGSNRLPKVVAAITRALEDVGVRFLFEQRVTGLVVERTGAERRAVGLRMSPGDDVPAAAVVLATGHSARDVYELLLAAEVPLQPKGFAMGVRIEHPQPLINRIQYGRYAEHPRLRSAYYKLSRTIRDRGVFSFCMCPGGWVVPAMTQPGELVVNGMSLKRRDSPFANSGLVVGIDLEDLRRAGLSPDRVGPLAGVELQRRLERRAYEAGGSRFEAPATRVTDFVNGRASTTVPDTSYIPGLLASDVAELLDSTGLDLTARLRDALKHFGKSMPGFVTEDAVMIGVESRTSAPVRVPRDPETLEAPVRGLYPAGEGAGYAGGIVSAAVDGLRVAESLSRRR